MKLIVDNRERKVNALLEQLMDERGLSLENKKVVPLTLGDFEIQNNEGKTLILFERKSLSDLLSSVMDGRYKEQSFRLTASPIHNHRVYYIIEGSLARYTERKNHPLYKKTTIYSLLYTLSYVKGFSVFCMENIQETANFIHQIFYKMTKEEEKNDIAPYYYESVLNKPQLDTKNCDLNDNTSAQETFISTTSSSSINYVETMKASKKSNLNESNIGMLMLCQVPSVSKQSAEIVMKAALDIVKSDYNKDDNDNDENDIKTDYNKMTLGVLVKALERKPNFMSELTYELASGKTRHLTKPCIENIKKFILS